MCDVPRGRHCRAASEGLGRRLPAPSVCWREVLSADTRELNGNPDLGKTGN